MAELEIIERPDEVDWQFLFDLLHRTYAYMDHRIDPPSSLHRLTVETLAQKASDEVLLLAKAENCVVGCMFCRHDPQWIYVGKVAVEEGFQGKGIARAMFDYAFAMARREGVKGLELESRIELIENHQAFSRLGFMKVGEDAHEGYDRPTSIRMRAEV